MAYADPTPLVKTITTLSLLKKKKAGEKFTVVALYDAPTASLAEEAGIECVLIGDSLGMTVQGHDSTVPVKMEHMEYHIAAVARGNKKSLIIGDLPYMAYATVEQACENATRTMQAGAHMIKIEGGAWLVPTVKLLSERGIPICAHLGLTPQSFHKLGGYRVQGRTEESAKVLLDDAIALEKAGADMVVLECVPAALAKTISEKLTIPVIGIGAGKDTDAQVLVINDILGVTPTPPKFSKDFLKETGSVRGALQKFSDDVKNKLFPAEENIFS